MSQKVNVNEILAKIYHIEERINLVEENVKSVQDPVLKNAVEVTGVLELSQLNIVDISVSELINIYNEVPQILNNLAIQVSLTPESYRQQTGSDLYLENNKQGNYWIIATENDIFWLVPKLNIKITSNTVRNLEYLFKCDGYQPNNKNDFALVKPAKISPVANLWKLETLGELDFTKTFKNVDLLAEINQLKQEIQEITQKVNAIYEINQNSELLKQSLTLQLEKLIEDYNTNFNLLEEQKTIIVRETDLSFNQRQSGNISNITFESTIQGIKGIYWIVTINDQYYLVYDKMRVKINDYNVKNVRAIFQCWGYQEGQKRDFDFKLIKPARVIFLNSNQWELVETGIIHCIN